MNNVLTMPVNEQQMYPHELAVITVSRPGFLPQAALAEAEGQRALLYSTEGLKPLTEYITAAREVTVEKLFELLSGYIRALIGARDMLLDTRLLSSDPEAGVFAAGSGSALTVKAVWGADAFTDESGKICRVARALSGCERIMGAKSSMERMITAVRADNPSLLNCLKLAETLCREWNCISGAPVPRPPQSFT